MKITTESYAGVARDYVTQQVSPSSEDGDKKKPDAKTVSTADEDTVDISSQAIQLSRAQLAAQASAAQKTLLEGQYKAMDAQSSAAEEENTPEDPMERFIKVMYNMMKERAAIWEENAAEQAERQKQEDAAKIKKAEAEAISSAETATLPESPAIVDDTADDLENSPLNGVTHAPPSDDDTATLASKPQAAPKNGHEPTSARQGNQEAAASYGRKGTPLRTVSIGTPGQNAYATKA